MNVRGTKLDEVGSVIGLINEVFRGERGGLPHTMREEFPLLLCEGNAKNMRIIEEEGEICSVVNFLPQKISIEGASISVGAIGAVCTEKSYRGRGLSSKILEDIEKRMKKLGISLCLVSGTGKLYRRWGTDRVRSVTRYRVPSKKTITDIKIREYKREDLSAIKRIYNAKRSRYIRSSEDFEILIESGTFPFGDTSYERFILEKNKRIVGYVILKKTKDSVEVKEAGGNMTNIFKGLEAIGTRIGVDEIDYYIPHGEEVYMDYKGEVDYLQGSLKIIDITKFIEELKSYFYQYVDGNLVDSLRIIEDIRGYIIEIDGEGVRIDSHEELLKLIFEKRERQDRRYSSNIEDFIERVFPIPFPWTENLNYQ